MQKKYYIAENVIDLDLFIEHLVDEMELRLDSELALELDDLDDYEDLFFSQTSLMAVNDNFTEEFCFFLDGEPQDSGSCDIYFDFSIDPDFDGDEASYE